MIQIWEKFKQKLHISKSQKAIDKLKNIEKGYKIIII